MEQPELPRIPHPAGPMGAGVPPADGSAAAIGPPGIWQRVKDSAHHPNSLTLFRVALIPLIILLFSFPNRFLAFVSALLFSLAAATDYFLILLAAHGWVPAWMVCLIIGRELTVTGLRSVIAGRGADVSASQLGKLKTGFQVAAIIPLMIHFPFLGLDCHAIGMVLLWLALGFTVWSGVDYFVKFKRIL